MAKSKDHAPDESLKGTNRTLRKQNTILKKEVAALRKRLAKYEGYVDNFTYVNDEEPEIELVDDDRCTQCSKGKLSTVDLGVRKITTCNVCGFREIVKV